MTVLEVLPLKFVSPLYVAVIECDPAVSNDVLKAVAPAFSMPVPIEAVPSKNVTVPVGVPPVPVTVAVNVTD